MNFLQPRRAKRRRNKKIVVIVVAALLIIIAGAVFAVRTPLLSLTSEAFAGRSSFVSAQESLKNRHFGEATEQINEAIGHFERAKEASQRLKLISWIPLLGRQLRAVDGLLDVGLQAGKAGKTLSSVAERIMEPIQKDGEVTFASIAPEEKRKVLKQVSEAEPDIQGAKADIDLAVLFLDDIPKSGLLPQLADAIEPLRQQLPELQHTLEVAVPAVRVIPSFVGYPTERSYLFLLQNNNELRPTGGFIGTYGVLKLKDGEVSSLRTDNIYNLDVQAEGFHKLDPPAPLKKYLKAEQWYMRDGNWSPDFPTAARTVLDLYDKETRSKHAFHGVIAITPTFIQRLMGLTGTITVDGVTFTKDNVIDQLQYQVEIAFVQKGITDTNRKDIIGDMSEILFDRLLTLPQEKWGELATILQESTTEKHFLLHLLNAEQQELVLDQGWGGEVRTAPDDSILVIDANLASLKTDQALERALQYRVALDGDDLVARLSIRYRHNGSFDWKTTRYRTYTRVYVPLGSTLRSHNGYLENDKLSGAKPGDVETSEELGKTVFGGFTSIEPKEERVLELEYVLPKTVADRFRDGTYELLAQKQGGTIAHGLTLDVELPGRLQSYSPDGNPTAEGRTVRYNTDLRHDREFQISFRP